MDDGGHLLLLERLDNTQVASAEVAIGKARTAAIFRPPSKVFEDQIREGWVAALALPRATPLQGDLPLVHGGAVIGAIGVSGSTPQEVNVEVVRLDPALDAIIPANPKIFKLAEGFIFTEGPLWVHGDYLLFSDIPTSQYPLQIYP